jgi:hypothetical protein
LSVAAGRHAEVLLEGPGHVLRMLEAAPAGDRRQRKIRGVE